MDSLHSTGFRRLHPLLYRFFVLCSVTLCVYLVFRYLLVYFFPFLFAYFMMRMLLPVIWFLHRRLHFPNWLAYGGTLTVFFCTVLGGIGVLGWQLWKQLRLFMSNFPSYRQSLYQMCSYHTGRICTCIDSMFDLSDGTSLNYLTLQLNHFLEGSGQTISQRAGNVLSSCFSGTVRFLTVLLMIVVSMAALCKDMKVVHRAYRKSPFFGAVHRVAVTMKKSGIAFLKSQGIILLVIWFICAVGLILIHNPYSILIGAGIAIFDTFPVLGSGMILVPWAVYEVFGHNYYAAVILFVVFLLCVVVRDLLEAHLMGNNMGLLPFFMTAALYIGVCLFGVWGILLGPFGVILIRAIYEQFIPQAESR